MPLSAHEESLIQTLHPVVAHKCRQHCALMELAKVRIAVGDCLRTKEQQAAEYAKGRNSSGVVISPHLVSTFSRPGWGWHEYGCAYHMTVLTPDGKHSVWDWAADTDLDHFADWQELGQAGESLGITWGGRWPKLRDGSHFEYHPGLPMEEVVQKFGVSRRIPMDYFV
jgi:hypothetical protein